MAETKSAPKSLYDLAKALGSWDDEGGAAGSSRADLGLALGLHAAEEHVRLCLGAAVIMSGMIFLLKSSGSSLRMLLL